MASKKTSRSPKSAAPAPPPEVVSKVPSPAARAPKAAAGVAPKKTEAAKPARRVATPKPRPAAATAAVPDAVGPASVSHEDIRVRAYFLSLEYLGSDRNDVDFWLLAERELRSTKTPGKP